MCRFLVNFNVEAFDLHNEHNTVQEWHPVFFGILPGDLNGFVHRGKVFGKGSISRVLNLTQLSFIPKRVSLHFCFERTQSFVFHLLHVHIG